MMKKEAKPRGFLFFFLLFSACGTEVKGVEDPATFQVEIWKSPPVEYYPRLRWWWPGGSVDEEEIKRELHLFKENGFGGVEIQPFTFGLKEENLQEDPEILTVGTEEFFEKIRKTLRIASGLGLKVDITFGSSWPAGGPFIKDGKARQLVMKVERVEGPSLYHNVLPKPEQPEYYNILSFVQDIAKTAGEFDTNLSPVAVVAGKKGVSDYEVEELVDVSYGVNGDTFQWEVPPGVWFLFFIYENFTNQPVFRHAFPGPYTASFVLDHLNRKGIEEMIEGYGKPLIAYTKDYIGTTFEALFLDSFELFSHLPWTDGFLERFRNEMGYDLIPYIPLLFRKFGEIKWLETMVKDSPVYILDEIGERVREDYEEVRSRLFREEFLIPFTQWAHRNGLKVRVQNHGGYEDFIEGYSMVDIPETEELYAGGSYDFMKLASSAAHVAGKRFVSSETFVSASENPRKLKEEDFYYLAGRAFSAGVNRIYYHGYPYLYYRDGRRWYPFDRPESSGFSFTTWTDETHHVWEKIKSINIYMARISYAMSLGESKAEIAWLYNERFFRDRVVFGFKGERFDSEITRELNRSGLTYDRINPVQLAGAEVKEGKIIIGKQSYSGLLVDNFHKASPELMKKIEEIADSSIPVVILGELPQRATGYVDAQKRDDEVREIAQRLMEKIKKAGSPQEIGEAFFEKGVKPPLFPESGSSPFVINHRVVKNGEIFLLFNEKEESHEESFSGEGNILLFDPQTGKQLKQARKSAHVRIQPRRCVILFLHKN